MAFVETAPKGKAAPKRRISYTASDGSTVVDIEQLAASPHFSKLARLSKMRRDVRAGRLSKKRYFELKAQLMASREGEGLAAGHEE